MANELEELDKCIEQASVPVKLGDALKRLLNSKDFKQVVLEGYFKEEAIRLVHLKSASTMQSKENQDSIISQINAIGSFRQYLDMVQYKADLAAKSIESAEEAKEEYLLNIVNDSNGGV